MTAEVTSCRCCNATPLVGWLGLCKDCNDAVVRVLNRRRSQLRARGLVK